MSTSMDDVFGPPQPEAEAPAPEQQAERVFLLGDRPFRRGHLSPRDVEQLLGLADVQVVEPLNP